MAGEDAFSVLEEYQELFIELGEGYGVAQLRVIESASVQRKPTWRDLELSTLDTNGDPNDDGPRVDDPGDRDQLGITSLDVKLFKVWGGVFDDTDPDDDEYVRAAQLLANWERNLRRATLPGGGVVFHGVLHPLIDAQGRGGAPYKRGPFSLHGVVMDWYIITESVRLDR